MVRGPASRWRVQTLLESEAGPADGKPERLAHAGVKDVAAITWRPMAKNFLALAHAGGVCLWTCDSVSAPALAGGEIKDSFAVYHLILAAYSIATVFLQAFEALRPLHRGGAQRCSAKT